MSSVEIKIKGLPTSVVRKGKKLRPRKPRGKKAGAKAKQPLEKAKMPEYSFNMNRPNYSGSFAPTYIERAPIQLPQQQITQADVKYKELIDYLDDIRKISQRQQQGVIRHDDVIKEIERKEEPRIIVEEIQTPLPVVQEDEEKEIVAKPKRVVKPKAPPPSVSPTDPPPAIQLPPLRKPRTKSAPKK
jgi:hypothetical protein